MYDLPGRGGNLPKDSINGTLSGISEIPTFYPSDFSMCREQPAAQDFGCQNSTMDKEDLIPPRRIQYDISVEKQLNMIRGRLRRVNPMWVFIAILIIFWLLSR